MQPSGLGVPSRGGPGDNPLRHPVNVGARHPLVGLGRSTPGFGHQYVGYLAFFQRFGVFLLELAEPERPPCIDPVLARLRRCTRLNDGVDYVQGWQPGPRWAQRVVKGAGGHRLTTSAGDLLTTWLASPCPQRAQLVNVLGGRAGLPRIRLSRDPGWDFAA